MGNRSLQTLQEKRELRLKKVKTAIGVSYFTGSRDLNNHAFKEIESVTDVCYFRGWSGQNKVTDALKEIELANSVLTEEEQRDLKHRKKEIRMTVAHPVSVSQEVIPLLRTLETVRTELLVVYPQILLTNLADGQV